MSIFSQNKKDLLPLLILCSLSWSNLKVESFVLLGLLILFYFIFHSSPKVWKYIKYFIALFCFPYFGYIYGGIKQIEPAASTLFILSFLKYSEISDLRDKLSYFSFLFLTICSIILLSDQVLLLLASLFVVLYIFRELGRLNNLKLNLRKILKYIIPGLIFTSLIYLFIPQVKFGNLLNFKSQKASGGFSTTLEPGDFTSIVRNDDIYFLVSYKDTPTDVYWRGMTYNYTDGRKWSQRRVKFKTYREKEANKLSQLDIFVLKSDNLPIFKSSGYELSLKKGQTKYSNKYRDTYLYNELRRNYRLKIKLKSTREAPTQLELQLPKREIPQEFKSFLGNVKGINTPQRILSLIDLFKQLDLKYSLDTPEIKGGIDEFMFKTKEGYCSHFSSAFAISLRYLGIPANVVGGFYGGEVNQGGKVIVVKGQNAHSWVEYWDGESWQRIDPVAEIISSVALPRNDVTLSNSGETNFKISQNFVKEFFDKIQYTYLLFNMRFFQFDLEKQLVWFFNLKKMFSDNLLTIGYWGIGIVIFSLCLYIVILYKRKLKLNDDYFFEILKGTLDIRYIHNLELISSCLVERGVEKSLVSEWRELFCKKNYSSESIDSSRYLNLKRSIIKSLTKSSKDRKKLGTL